jgi:hypothetical protein
MSFVRRAQLGEWLPLFLQCLDDADNHAKPDTAPTLNVYNSDNKAVTATKSMVPSNEDDITGFFQYELLLGSGFAVGTHTIRYAWSVDGKSLAATNVIEIVPGGDARGAYLGLAYYNRPHAPFIVGQTDADLLESRMKPRV